LRLRVPPFCSAAAGQIARGARGGGDFGRGDTRVAGVVRWPSNIGFERRRMYNPPSANASASTSSKDVPRPNQVAPRKGRRPAVTPRQESRYQA
jgi:hypothetical protein